MSPITRRKSSRIVAIGAVSALAIALTGCSSDEETQETDADYAQVCVDEQTQERVEDKECEDTSHSHSSHAWMWMPFFLNNNRANTIPAVGDKISANQQATKRNPQEKDENSTSTVVGSRGGTVSKSDNGKTTVKSGTSRGGFGSKGGGSGS